MPARHAVLLTEGSFTMMVSSRAGEDSVKLTFKVEDKNEASIEVPVNDFKDFLGLLETIKPALLTPVHKAKPEKTNG